MKKLSRNTVRATLWTLCTIALPVCMHQAQAASSYPDRPITIVVGYPAGGSVDLNGRVVAETLAKKIGANVVVENLGGAGGTIGAQKVIRAKPDGYTLLVGSLNEIVIASLVNPAVKYDGLTDLQPIGLIGDQPLVLAASKLTDIKQPSDLVKVAKAGKSAEYSYGSSGVGTSLHMAGEMVNAELPAKFMHVPYRGVSPLVTDLTSGRLALGVFALSSALPQIESGQINAIGVTSAKRSFLAKDIPALAETPALKAMDISVWFGLFGPKGMPADVVNKLQTSLGQVLADPEFQKKYRMTGSNVMLEQRDVAAFLASEHDKFKKLAQTAHIAVEKP